MGQVFLHHSFCFSIGLQIFTNKSKGGRSPGDTFPSPVGGPTPSDGNGEPPPDGLPPRPWAVGTRERKCLEENLTLAQQAHLGSQENSVIHSKGLFQSNEGHDSKSRLTVFFTLRHIRIKILLLSFKNIHFLNEHTGKNTYLLRKEFIC